MMRRYVLVLLLGLVSGLCMLGGSPAEASVGSGVWWKLTLGARPSMLPSGGEGELVTYLENVGYKPANSSGGSAVIRDTVPANLEIGGVDAAIAIVNARTELPCIVSGQTVSCEFQQELQPYSQIELRIRVNVTSQAATGEVNEASVTGGEANPARATSSLQVGEENTAFGLQSYTLLNEEEGGAEDIRAGSHPFQQTSQLELNQTGDTVPLPDVPNPEPASLPKDFDFRWPAGLIGNPNAVPECTSSDFVNVALGGSLDENECPADTAVGVATVVADEPSLLKTAVFTVPVFNLEPEAGEPARFGFYLVEAGTPVYIDTSVRTGSDYGVNVESKNIPQTAGVLSAKVTVWGTPASPVHDAQRGWGCLFAALKLPTVKPCNKSENTSPTPFLALPTKCGVPLESVVTGDSWLAPGLTTLASYVTPVLGGCSELSFAPELGIQGTTGAASSPTGLKVSIYVPKDANRNARGVNSSAIRTVNVRFPAGVTVNPAAANGMSGCTEGQVGYLPGVSAPPSDLTFTAASTTCPPAARLGTVKIKTPLLPRPLEGYLYLASPENFVLGPPGENPFKSLIATYMIAEEPVSHVLIKLPGSVSLNEATGQVETTFENTPDVSLEDAEVALFTGDRAAFTTPQRCGRYTTTASFTPWSGEPTTTSSADLEVGSGPGGTACPGATLPFATQLRAGASDPRAGAFTPFSTRIARSDGQQAFKQVSVQLPPGLSGVLTGIPLCGEAQANAGTCDAASLVGHASAEVGVGGEPFTVSGGRVYLTEHYAGAPFGLSIVTPAVAGPFDLGDVIVRAKVDVNPITAAITVTTDGAGQYSIPGMLRGIPLQIKALNVVTDRPGFTFNPTSCGPLQITAATTGAEGGTSIQRAPFSVTNCASLAFAPKFAVAASGKNSKADGASLSVKLAYPTAPLGTQANIKRVKVELPKALPSRLTTLQKACTAAQFNANPAGCPAASVVGHARAITPILPVALEGPAYFVSNGGEAFPNLILVLQGYGVTIDLVGDTFISKAGVTSSTFKAVPDQPISSFELTLPQGPYSALTALGELCTQKLSMPTEFIAQNGMTLHQATPVGINGCPKKKALTRRQKLAAALKTCHKDKSKAKRAKCERQARKRYGPTPKKKTKRAKKR
jgi:hypothetical protein